MSVKKIRNMGKQLTKQAARLVTQGFEENKPTKQAAKVWAVTAAQEPEPPETAVEKTFRKAQADMDTAGRKFHEDSGTHLEKAKKALAKAEAHYRKAWTVHDKKTRG